MKSNAENKSPKDNRSSHISKWVRTHVVSVIRLLSRVCFFIALPSLYIFSYFGLIEILVLLRDGEFSFTSAWPSLISLAAEFSCYHHWRQNFLWFYVFLWSVTGSRLSDWLSDNEASISNPQALGCDFSICKIRYSCCIDRDGFNGCCRSKVQSMGCFWYGIHSRKRSEFPPSNPHSFTRRDPAAIDPGSILIYRAIFLPLLMSDWRCLRGFLCGQARTHREAKR